MTIGNNIRRLRKQKGLTLNQLATAIDSDVGNLSRLERGQQGYSEATVTKIAGALNVAVAELFAAPDELEEIGTGNASAPGTELRGSAVQTFHPDDPLPDHLISVPESRIEFSAGPGKEMHFEFDNESEAATYRLSWFHKERINPDRVRRFRVSGESMEPFLFHRDTVLVNMDETEVIDGKLYAIRYGNDLRVKFLFRRLDGTLILRSMNPAFPDEEVPRDLANEHIEIIGRVRDKSGKGGL